jgi:hypothetical protein
MAKTRIRKPSERNRARRQGTTDARVARVLRDVKSELDRGRGTKAAKLYLDAQAHDLLPTGADLPAWLARTLGKAATAKLVEAFAHFPCFYCKNGIAPCEKCEGHGQIGGGVICEVCLGLKAARCEFCDGSGWVAMNLVPEGLRPLVLRERMDWACRQIDALLKRAVPQASRNEAAAIAKRCARLVLDLNRNIGILENGVVAAKSSSSTNKRSQGGGARIVRTSCQAAAKAELRIRELIRQMGRTFRLQAEQADESVSRPKHLRQAAEFYDSLAASKTLAGTCLEHPFLREAAKELLKKRAKATGRTKGSRRKRKVRRKKSERRSRQGGTGAQPDVASPNG